MFKQSFHARGLPLMVGLALFAGPLSAQDFDWSWEQDAAPAAPAAPAAEEAPGEEFDWEWERPGTESPAAAETGRRRPQSAPVVDPADYNEVMRENIELRKQLAEKERLAEQAAQEVQRLAREKQVLQGQMNTLAATMEQLENARGDVADDAARARQLEQKLAEAESEKARLARRMTELETNLEELSREESPLQAPVAAAVPAEGGVRPGSDLFREMQEENARLKERLDEIEDAQAKAARMEDRVEQVVEQSRDRQEDLQDRLKASKATEEDQKELIARLLRRMPEMEEELERLRERAGGKQSVLAAREREIANVHEELRRREHRLIKAERMATMLDEARDEVKAVSEEQQRNMHYNMAVVYAKEGRFKEAEQEYLRALRIDPAFADAHYNLAILYDDELSSKKRAAMHYRKYLQLNPNAPDRDQVRQWIMRVEM